MASAYKRQNVVYPDYNPKKDFTSWLAGYREKSRNAHGLTHAQNDEVDAEVLKSISSKLECGTALDAYNGLPAAAKGDYNQMVKLLTEEFMDPQERQRFLSDFSYNKRKKGQSLKDFVQDIKKSQNKYSGMPDTYQGPNNTNVVNKAKIADGIRRFCKGIRNRKGKKDKEQMKQLKYNLHREDDQTWEHALDVAGRWEAANDYGSSSSASSSSSEDDDNEDEVEAVTSSRKSKKSKKKGKKAEEVGATTATAPQAPAMAAAAAAPPTPPPQAAAAVAAVATDKPDVIATITARLETNERDIKGVKSEQERLAANVAAWEKKTDGTLSEILSEVRSGKQQIAQTQQHVQQLQLQQQQTSLAQQNQNQNYQQNRQQNYRNPNRPNTYVWKGQVGQNQQTGFNYNRRTPAQFPQNAAAAAPQAQAAAAPAATPAAAPVAAVDNIDPAAQPLGNEGGIGRIMMDMDQFYEIMDRANQPVDNNDIVSAVSDLNFQ